MKMANRLYSLISLLYKHAKPPARSQQGAFALFFCMNVENEKNSSGIVHRTDKKKADACTL